MNHFMISQDISVKAEEIGPLTTGLVNVTAFSLIDQESREWAGMVRDWNRIMVYEADPSISPMKYVSTERVSRIMVDFVKLVPE